MWILINQSVKSFMVHVRVLLPFYLAQVHPFVRAMNVHAAPSARAMNVHAAPSARPNAGAAAPGDPPVACPPRVLHAWWHHPDRRAHDLHVTFLIFELQFFWKLGDIFILRYSMYGVLCLNKKYVRNSDKDSFHKQTIWTIDHSCICVLECVG